MKTLTTIYLIMMAALAFGQVQLDKPLQLTGSGLDARVEGIDTAVAPGDAVPLKMLEAIKPLPPVYIGSITGVSINSAPADSLITIWLNGTGVIGGYVVSAVWIEVKEEFISFSTVSPLLKRFESASPPDIISFVPPFTENTLNSAGITRLDMSGGYTRVDKHIYSNQVVIGFAGVNPKDFNTSAECRIYLELLPATF